MNVNCPVCLSNSNNTIRTHKKWKIPILQCSDCTHVFASQHIEEADDSFSTSKKRAQYYLDALAPLTPSTMMDIGTPADFFFLKQAHKQFPSAKKYALDLYEKVHPNFVEMLYRFPPEPIDICTVFHVLEHVRDPHPFIASIINTSKYFIIEVPNCDSPTAIRDSSCNPHTHFFNEKSFQKVFGQYANPSSFMIRTGKDMPWKKSTLVAYHLPTHCELKNQKQTAVDFLLTQKLYVTLGIRKILREFPKNIFKPTVPKNT